MSDPPQREEIPTGQPPVGTMISGKLVILSVFALAVAASFGSWYYYAQLQKRPLDLWGADAADLMLRAKTVTAYRLVSAPLDATAPSTEQADDELEFALPAARAWLVVGGEKRKVAHSRDISTARGLSHIRQSFVHDRSFVWDEPLSDCQPTWDYALDFSDGTRSTIVAFALDCHWMQSVKTDRGVSVRPIVAELKSFLQEQFADEAGRE